MEKRVYTASHSTGQCLRADTRFIFIGQVWERTNQSIAHVNTTEYSK